MGRIVRSVCVLLLAFGLFSYPVTARASDGFLGGLEDLTGTRQVEQEQKGYEDSYQESYEPELREVETQPVRALPENATTVDYINDTVDSFNQVGFANASTGNVNTRSLLESVKIFLGNSGTGYGGIMRDLYLFIAIGIVFLWWGVRKTKIMIMSAFRKGKASI